MKDKQYRKGQFQVVEIVLFIIYRHTEKINKMSDNV